MKALLVLLSVVLLNLNTQAYSVASLEPNYDPNKPTDVYLIGYGKALGLQFLYTALARAYKTKEIFPQNQQLFVWAKEWSEQKDRAVLERLGLNIIKTNDKMITPGKAKSEIKDHVTKRNVMSFHLVSHNSGEYGAALEPVDDNDGREHDYEKKFTASSASFLKKYLSKDYGYIFLHGCNSGFKEGPQYTKLTKAPTFASLSTTGFEQLYTDGKWYKDYSSHKPKGYSMSKSNYVFLNNPTNCTDKSCVTRLKPENVQYQGYWGKYTVGLNFFKVFCKEKDAQCLTAIHDSILSFPSVKKLNINSSKQDYKEVLFDYFCPNKGNRPLFDNCKKKLEKVEVSKNLRIFDGTEPTCSLKKCDFKEKSEIKKEKKSGFEYEIVNYSPKGKETGTTLVDEYLLYLEAFDFVKSQQRR